MQSVANREWGQSTTAFPIWWDFSGPRPEMIYPGCPLTELRPRQLKIIRDTHPDYCYADDARRELTYRRGYCD